MRPARTTGMLLAALALVVAPACGDDATDVERADVSSTTTERDGTTTSTTEAPTATTLPPCPDPPTPADGTDPVTTTADVDGDGQDDELRSHGPDGGAWRIEVALARGGAVTLELESAGSGVGVLGGADVDGDGAAEVWARTGAGASTVIVGLLRLDGCDLRWVRLPGGSRAELPVGGSVGTTAGVGCTEDGGADLRAYQASYVGDGTSGRYEVTAVGYELEGTDLVERERTTTEVDAGDPSFARYTSFSCGDLSL